MKVICNETGLSANFSSEWFPINIQGANPKQKIVVLGYWKTAGVTRDSTIKIRLTTDKAKAISDGLYDDTNEELMSTADGQFAFNIDNYGFKWYQLIYTLNTSSGVAELYAESNAEEV